MELGWNKNELSGEKGSEARIFLLLVEVETLAESQLVPPYQLSLRLLQVIFVKGLCLELPVSDLRYLPVVQSLILSERSFDSAGWSLLIARRGCLVGWYSYSSLCLIASLATPHPLIEPLTGYPHPASLQICRSKLRLPRCYPYSPLN